MSPVEHLSDALRAIIESWEAEDPDADGGDHEPTLFDLVLIERADVIVVGTPSGAHVSR